MNKAKRFLSNALMLSCVSIVMRGIAVSFNAYITKKIGAESMGLFTLVMSVYGFAVTVALSCVNLAAVRLTSERCALLDGADRTSWKFAMKHVVRAVVQYSLIFGTLSAVCLYWASGFLSVYVLKDTRTLLSLKLMAVSLPAVSLSSALSGYFTGLRKVSKNAVSTMIEQFLKIVITSTALAVIIPGDVEKACLAVVGGGVLAEAGSLIVNMILYFTDSGKPADQIYGTKALSLNTSFKNASSISLPAAVGSYARQGLTTLEHLAIPAGLRKSGLSAKKALASYGLMQGIALPLVMFPYAVIGSFTSLLIPEMAEKHELRDTKGMLFLTEEVYRYSAIFSMGACGIFANYASDLGLLIYDSSEAAVYTLLLGLLVPFMYLDTAVDSLLKGLGEQVYIMKVNILDSAGGLLLVMLTIPHMGIMGYILTIWICELGNLSASISKLGKITGAGILSAVHFYLRPAIIILVLTVIKQIWMANIPTIPSIFLYAGIYISLNVLVSQARKTKRPAAASLF